MKKKIFLCLSLLLSLVSCNSNPPVSSEIPSSSSTTSEITHEYAVDIPTIAHRGYAVNEVENTAGAFIEAGKRNFIGIETDIYFTKDGWIVCNHNNKVNGMDKNISECTYEEIMQVNLSPTYDKDVFVCTFNEYLRICAQYNKIPVIEFKTTPSLNNCEVVLDVISKEYGDVNNVIFISFGRKILQQMQKLADMYEYSYQLFRLTQDDNAVAEAIEDKMGVNHQYNILSEENIKKAKDAGLPVAAWTVNDEKWVKQLIQMGVDYVTTDYIECDEKYIVKK